MAIEEPVSFFLPSPQFSGNSKDLILYLTQSAASAGPRSVAHPDVLALRLFRHPILYIPFLEPYTSPT